jgi:hypothetical protein
MQSETNYFRLFINDLENSALDKKSAANGQRAVVGG